MFQPVKYQVICPNGAGSVTYYPSQMDIDYLESQAKAGCKFKINDRVMSKRQVLDFFATHGLYVPEAEEKPEKRKAAKTGAKPEAPVADPKPEEPAVGPKPSATATPATEAKRILCVETGQIFNKQSEAAKALNIDPAQVSDSIKTGRPRSGYTFQKVV